MTDRVPPALRVRHDGVLVEVRPGEVVEIEGVVAGALARPGAPGSVRLGDRDVSRWDAARRARAGLVVLGGVEVAPEESVIDHLRAVDPGRATDVLEQAPLLGGRGGDPAGWLSGGERQVLGWLQTLLAAPSVVVLDVAGRGLDVPTLAWAQARIADWVDSGVGVLVHVGRPEEEPWLAVRR